MQSIEEIVKIEKASLGFYVHEAEGVMLKETVSEGLFRDSTDLVKIRQELVDKHKLKL